MDSLSAQEVEFERRLAALERDSRQCAAFAYTQLTQEHFENDSEVFYRLQTHAGFWIRVRAALQVSVFVTVSRMFDRTANTDTIRRALDHAQDNYGIFGKNFLRTRKERAGLSSEAAERFADAADQIPQSAWQDLQTEVNEKQRIFDEQVAPIRHSVFAHAGKINAEERDSLFTALMVRTLEDLCVFPLRLSRALSLAYNDGVAPKLSDAPTRYADVLKALPGKHVSTWDHLHAARDASEFFEWLGSTQLDQSSDESAQ